METLGALSLGGAVSNTIRKGKSNFVVSQTEPKIRKVIDRHKSATQNLMLNRGLIKVDYTYRNRKS